MRHLIRFVGVCIIFVGADLEPKNIFDEVTALWFIEVIVIAIGITIIEHHARK